MWLTPNEFTWCPSVIFKLGVPPVWRAFPGILKPDNNNFSIRSYLGVVSLGRPYYTSCAISLHNHSPLMSCYGAFVNQNIVTLLLLFLYCSYSTVNILITGTMGFLLFILLFSYPNREKVLSKLLLNEFMKEKLSPDINEYKWKPLQHKQWSLIRVIQLQWKRD